MPLSLLDLFAILVTGLMVGNEFAVAAFIHPAISRLNPPAHAAAAKGIATTLGRIMPFWYALVLLTLLADLWRYRSFSHTAHLLASAAALWTVTILVTIFSLVPRNNRIARLDPDHPYATWLADRSTWDTLHRIRVAALTLAFALLVLALLPPR